MMLVATGRAIPPGRWIDSLSEEAERQDLESLV